MSDLKLTAKSKLVLAATIAVSILFCYFMIINSGIVPGVDSTTDRLKDTSLSTAYRNTVIEGTITDRSGEVIVSASDVGTTGYCFHPSFSYLVGYNSRTYGTCGLRGRFEKYLFMGDENDRGATVRLTADAGLQDYAASLIADIDGSIVVLESKTGRILALASHAQTDYNVNQLGERWSEYNSYDGFFYTNGIRDNDPPGSTFKIVTSAAMLENGMADATYHDDGSATFGGSTIHNAGDAAYGDLDLQTAFAKSANTYFATMAVRLGADKLESTAKDFLIGESIALDFTTLHSGFSLGDGSDMLVAQTGFGQGNTQIAPLHIAMITQSIANDGIMLEPYLIDSITLGSRRLRKGDTNRLTRTVKRGTARSIADMMRYTAVEQYGFAVDDFGEIGAKTGTAELANGKYHAYLTSFSEDYVVVVSANDTSLHGSGLRGYAKSVYQYLRNESNDN